MHTNVYRGNLYKILEYTKRHIIIIQWIMQNFPYKDSVRGIFSPGILSPGKFSPKIFAPKISTLKNKEEVKLKKVDNENFKGK